MHPRLLSFFLLLSLSSAAQDSSFLLKTYKYRTPGFKALELNLSLSGSWQNEKQSNFSESSRTSFSSWPASVQFSTERSTDERLHQSTVLVRTYYESERTKSNGSESTSNRFSPFVSWETSDRFYRTGGWFWEVGNELSFQTDNDRRKDPASDYHKTQRDASDRVTLGFGRGRVERVQDAQMALYLLQDLAKQGLLRRDYTAEEAYALARLVTDINNRRVFDLRKRRIYELTRLDSFFRTSGLAPQPDVRHFATINDNWALALNPGRSAGGNWYVRLQPQLSESEQRSRYGVSPASWKRNDLTLGVSPVVGYENYHPLSLKWQRNAGVSATYVLSRNKQKTESLTNGQTTKSDTTFSSGRAALYGFYGIGFYPNNRTVVEATLNVTGTLYSDKSRELWSWLYLSANYFLGYRTSLRATASINYDGTHVPSTPARPNAHLFSGGFSLSFAHVLF